VHRFYVVVFGELSLSSIRQLQSENYELREMPIIQSGSHSQPRVASAGNSTSSTYLKVRIVALGLLFCLGGCCSKTLFSEAVQCPRAVISTNVLACNIVVVDKAALEKADKLTVRLPDDGSVTFRRIAVVRGNAEAFVWRGKLDGKGFSRAFFSVVKDAVVGTVLTNDGRMYRLRKTSHGLRIFERLDSKMYRVRDNHEKTPQSKELPLRYPRIASAAIQAPSPTCDSDSPDRIDVMVLYTPAALTEAGDENEMTAWIKRAEDETNDSYSNSGVSQRIKVLTGWTRVVQYVERDISADLDALVNRSDGAMDEVHSWRNDAGADLVVLITHISSFGTGGYAYTLQPEHVGNKLFERKAFAVVQQEHFSTPDYIFAHELGHLMGAQHDQQSSPGQRGAFTFSHGHVNSSPTPPCTEKWKTIMSEESCCTTWGYWSAPTTSPDTCGDPWGDASEEANSTTLNKTAPTVANFRCSVPLVQQQQSN
jgi:hypothetical protein